MYIVSMDTENMSFLVPSHEQNSLHSEENELFVYLDYSLTASQFRGNPVRPSRVRVFCTRTYEGWGR